MPFQGTLQAVAGAMTGAILGDSEVIVTGVFTDSRDVTDKSLFVARTGEALNGHDFIDAAVASGAAACVVERAWASAQPSNWNRIPAIVVEDSTLALGKLAQWWRRECRLPTAAITGSNGKTTTKELTRGLLEDLVGKGTASSKSYNNNVGLPQTILGSDPSDKWLLLEAGMNHPGELDYLGSIATPDAAVVLNIGPAHIGFFGTLARIADAKCELLNHIAPGGVAIVNADDKELLAGVSRLEKSLASPLRKFTFGTSSAAQLRATSITDQGVKGSAFNLSYQGNEVHTSIPLLGVHNVMNALAGGAIALSLFPSVTLEALAKTLPKVQGAPMRLQVREVGKITLLNDAYNANPASMSSAIRTVVSTASGKPFAVVVADMLELGEFSDELHRQLGAEIAAAQPVLLIALGNYAKTVCEAATAAGASQVIAAQDPKQAADVLYQHRASFSYCLVKGSRGMALERVVNAFVEAMGR